MIECPYLTEAGTCLHVDQGVGLPIVISPSACAYCVEHYPEPKTRKRSYAVQCWIRKERIARGLPGAKPKRKIETPPGLVDVIAPVVPDPDERLAICEDCDQWKGERCRAACTCKTRPRPLAESGQDCPRKMWRRG